MENNKVDVDNTERQPDAVAVVEEQPVRGNRNVF